MMLSLAPMEGVTGHAFRAVYAECFGDIDRYYTPFVAPPRVGSAFGKKAMAELDPERNQGLDVVPQLLTKDADEFVWAAQLLAEMGYREVNLNLGCPSGTVFNKGRGSGLLRDPEALDAFLDEVCERSPLPVSVKTRIGVASDDEYGRILATYCKHPLAELIVHPRIRTDFYKGTPRWRPYGETLARAPFPVAYNGDVFSPRDLSELIEAYPETRHVMLGRGVAANPALPRVLHGGAPLSLDELRRFHDRLYAVHEKEMGGNAVGRMKEWWFYAERIFDSPLYVHRAIRKARRAGEYRTAVEKVFQERRLTKTPYFTSTPMV